MLTYTIIVNSTVHMFMYSYYLMAIFSKQLPFKLNAMKKFITVFQIVSNLQQISIFENHNQHQNPFSPPSSGSADEYTSQHWIRDARKLFAAKSLLIDLSTLHGDPAVDVLQLLLQDLPEERETSYQWERF